MSIALRKPEPEVEAPEAHPHVPHPWDWATALILGLVHLGALAAPWTFSWSGLAVGFVLYVLTAGSITLGYHRLLTHRSYKTPRWVECLLALLASQACQGGPVRWTAVHRLHHKHADQEGDPHGANQGFWWAHVGWMLTQPPHKLDPHLTQRFAPDLYSDPFHQFLERHFLKFVVLVGFLLLGLGGVSWLVYGMFVRLVAVYHATWLVNSAAHMFGYRSHKTRDLSTNCWWVALVTFGEGWHNNHHAFPHSARHGLAWWELDLTWATITAMEKLGLAWDIKLPKISAGGSPPAVRS